MIVLLDQTSLNTPSRSRGHGRYVYDLARGLAALSAADRGDLRFVALTHLASDGSYRVTEDLASFRGNPDITTPTAKDHYHWAYSRRFGLSRAVRAIGARLVHLGDPNATPLFMGLTRCKRVVTCHDTIPARYPSRYFGYKDGGPFIGLAIERRRYHSADLVVAISDATQSDARNYLKVPDRKMVRIYNGVDVERWATQPTRDKGAVLDRYGLTGRAFLLYVGGPDWHKNVQGMFAGLARARAAGVDLVLAWAGKLSEEQRDKVSELARTEGVKDSVMPLGFVEDEDLSVLYREATAHVLMSRCEGFGLTVVEAMAAGCPVLTTQGGSLAEVAGDAALTAGPDDYEAIGSSMARLATDTDLRGKLASRGRMRAPTFSLEVQAKAMAQAYRHLLGV